tara:strand:+ start:5503 stop:5742 length:240 start_codon:yes stop_codon:yes gene_type:complete
MQTSFIPKSKDELLRRRELTDDLMFVVKEDNSVLEQILDDYVYRLSDNEVNEYEVLVGSIIDDDKEETFIDINNTGGKY